MTSGCSPALASSADRAMAPLSIWTVSRVSPSGVRRTITLRRRCRSIPTYCGPGCTVTFFRREVFGLATPSLTSLGSSRREEVDLTVRRPSPLPEAIDMASTFPTRRPARRINQARHAGAALRSFITSRAVLMLRPPCTPSASPLEVGVDPLATLGRLGRQAQLANQDRNPDARAGHSHPTITNRHGGRPGAVESIQAPVFQ